MTVTKSRRGLFLLSLLFKKQRNLPQKLPDFPHMSCWPGLVIRSLSIVMGPEPTRSCCRGWHWGTRKDRDLGTIGSVSSEEVGGPSGGLLTVSAFVKVHSRQNNAFWKAGLYVAGNGQASTWER